MTLTPTQKHTALATAIDILTGDLETDPPADIEQEITAAINTLSLMQEDLTFRIHAGSEPADIEEALAHGKRIMNHAGTDVTDECTEVVNNYHGWAQKTRERALLGPLYAIIHRKEGQS